jgi:hypothetical protein
VIWNDRGRDEEDVACSFCDVVDIVSAKSGKLLHKLTSKNTTNEEMGYGRAMAVIAGRSGSTDPRLMISETETNGFFGSIHCISTHDNKEQWTSSSGLKGPSGEIDDIHHYGYRLATLGDLDGDGIDDLVVGSQEATTGERGIARVISGKNGRVLFECTRGQEGIITSRPDVKHDSPR